MQEHGTPSEEEMACQNRVHGGERLKRTLSWFRRGRLFNTHSKNKDSEVETVEGTWLPQI